MTYGATKSLLFQQPYMYCEINRVMYIGAYARQVRVFDLNHHLINGITQNYSALGQTCAEHYLNYIVTVINIETQA